MTKVRIPNLALSTDRTSLPTCYYNLEKDTRNGTATQEQVVRALDQCAFDFVNTLQDSSYSMSHAAALRHSAKKSHKQALNAIAKLLTKTTLVFPLVRTVYILTQLDPKVAKQWLSRDVQFAMPGLQGMGDDSNPTPARPQDLDPYMDTLSLLTMHIANHPAKYPIWLVMHQCFGDQLFLNWYNPFKNKFPLQFFISEMEKRGKEIPQKIIDGILDRHVGAMPPPQSHMAETMIPAITVLLFKGYTLNQDHLPTILQRLREGNNILAPWIPFLHSMNILAELKARETGDLLELFLFSQYADQIGELITERLTKQGYSHHEILNILTRPK